MNRLVLLVLVSALGVGDRVGGSDAVDDCVRGLYADADGG